MGISISFGASLAIEKMGQTVGGWTNIAGGVARVDGNSGSMGLGAPLANKMGEAKCGGTNIAGGVPGVESNSCAVGLSASLANEMRGRVSMGETICGGANIAGGESRVECNSRLSTSLPNMRVTPDCGSDIAGGDTRVDCDTKTEAMRLSQGSGKEGGGENLRIDAVRKRIQGPGMKNLQRTSCC